MLKSAYVDSNIRSSVNRTIKPLFSPREITDLPFWPEYLRIIVSGDQSGHSLSSDRSKRDGFVCEQSYLFVEKSSVPIPLFSILIL